ncbi:hypothetical protein HYR99_13620 [Candidatus Poribacteria bacterium]|nr:hypothetical protein [Candidatus Poribacteria bacterium]
MNFARFNVKQLCERRLRWGLAFLIAMVILPGFLSGLERTAWAQQQNAT